MNDRAHANSAAIAAGKVHRIRSKSDAVTAASTPHRLMSTKFIVVNPARSYGFFRTLCLFSLTSEVDLTRSGCTRQVHASLMSISEQSRDALELLSHG
jgi:hypothetical protein